MFATRRSSLLLVAVSLALVLLAAPPVLSHGPGSSCLIQLPDDFGPEGIAVGNGSTFYVGSIAPATAGQILTGDLETGHFHQLVAPSGITAFGLKHDSRSDLLFVAGGPSGRATVYDAISGAEIGFYQLKAPGTGFINDVLLTSDAAYFTDSAASENPVLFWVPLGPHGEPGPAFDEIPLPADFAVAGPYNPATKGNGMAATSDGKVLLIVHTGLGKLYRMDTETYETVQVVLSGGDGDVGHGDGLLLQHETLYVVQNRFNKVAVIKMAPNYFSGVIKRYITEPFASNPATKVPTTIAKFDRKLYTVTAGFAPPAPDFVVCLPK